MKSRQTTMDGAARSGAAVRFAGALALTAVLLAPAAASAAPRDARVKSRAVSGTLQAESVFLSNRTVVRLGGRLSVRRKRVRLLLRACADSRCRRLSRGRGARRWINLRRGSGRRLSTKRALPPARAVLIVLRHGRRSVVRMRMRPPSRNAPREADPPPQPEGDPQPEPPAPGADPPAVDPGGSPPQGGGGTPDPPPATFSLSTDPPLSPAYSPATPDYGIGCAEGDPVEVTLGVPSASRVWLDGEQVPPGTSGHSVELAPGQAFRVAVDDGAGLRTHFVRCLPPDLPRWTVQRNGDPQMRWVVFVTALGPLGKPYVVIADDWGVPVWWLHYPTRRPVDGRILPDGRVAVGPGGGRGFALDSRYEIRRLDGTLDQEVGTDLDFHDLQQMPNGNFIVMAYVRREGVDLSSWGAESDAVVLDAEVREVTPAGAVVWSWNSAGIIHLEEADRHSELIKRTASTGSDGRKVYDIVHMNSVEPDGDGVVISLRYTDGVYRIRRSDGQVDWKIGGTTTPESLTLLNDPLAAERLGDQHDARVLADGTVTIHDNRQLRSGTPHPPPEMLRYSLDTTARTATLLERITDPGIPRGGCCGSTRKLTGGNWVTYWGGTQLITEHRPDGARVLTLQLPAGVFSYRGDPSESGPTRDEMRAGMDAMHPRSGAGP